MKDSEFLKKNERIDQLYSQNIKIIQSPDVFSFSLDVVLLAAFAQMKKSSKIKIMDLCAGNGAIGLFASQKTQGLIDQIEIQSKLADMGNRSIKLNHLEQRMKMYNLDVADTFKEFEKDTYDYVLCNPPYFKNQVESKKNPNAYLAVARHEIKTNLNQVLAISSGLLKMNGKLFLVHRPDRFLEILETLKQNRLAPKRIRLVYPRQHSEANMVLIEAIKDGRPDGIRFVDPLYTYRGKEYSDEVKRLLYGNQ
ncbi:tRNA1(Val) (adenine(37)-N6)-methyltransferase [Pediococcus ethanolidurans]|uniref:tRNA1(Val) (adenine(37)-N6)-methyltransferase n=1 Tax=Pediococcus ethanolidurans TaxID=319653 RepID=UPI001C1F0502|nr:tRNA1(Val) (adenine(37)-N6)-methyltransferase [Pediococcus ethanolidurans]MBU7564268.1 tRNA1(Val) (adenine(37)-N6)-methyltransferase [Pediococcus ethanolidurans]